MANPGFTDPNSRKNAFRRRRFRHVLKLIDAAIARTGSCRIIDVGGAQGYWQAVGDLLDQRNVSIDLINLSTEPVTDPRFRSLAGDACDLGGIADMSYDLAHSNSVIEHVGGWARMRAFAREIRRIAPAYFVQAPYLWFPLEPHFTAVGFQWLPEPMRAQCLFRRRMGYSQGPGNWDNAWADVEHARLPDRTMFRVLFPDAMQRAERVFGLTKSLMAIRPAPLRAA